MPRHYGRTSTSMWNDPDFLTLSPEARFTYSMLFNQAEITPVGVLGLTVRRFARNTGYSVETVRQALDELVKNDYIVVDDDTEEVFVRTFVKWDGGLNNDLRRKAVIASADAVASVDIRASIALQLSRFGIEDRASIGLRDASDTRRVVVNKGDHLSNPQPATINPHPESATREGQPHPADDVGAPPSMFCSKHPDGTEQPCGPCATARTRYAQHLEDTAGREAAAKRARVEAIANCAECDEHGRVLDAETGKPVGRCDHLKQSA